VGASAFGYLQTEWKTDSHGGADSKTESKTETEGKTDGEAQGKTNGEGNGETHGKGDRQTGGRGEGETRQRSGEKEKARKEGIVREEGAFGRDRGAGRIDRRKPTRFGDEEEELVSVATGFGEEELVAVATRFVVGAGALQTTARTR